MMPFIRLGAISFPAYGLMVMLALAAGLIAALYLSRKLQIESIAITEVAICGALGGIVGAKVLMASFQVHDYLQSPGRLISSGGVFYGGLALGAVIAYGGMRRWNLPPLVVADVFAPGIALGLAIGRIGCFAAGCCWGVQCDRPWAVVFRSADASRVSGVPLGVALHPAQIYEAIVDVAIFLLLWARWFRRARNGEIIALFVAMYSAARFCIEFFRVHDRANPILGNLPFQQWIALAGLALSCLFLLTPALRRAS